MNIEKLTSIATKFSTLAPEALAAAAALLTFVESRPELLKILPAWIGTDIAEALAAVQLAQHALAAGPDVLKNVLAGLAALHSVAA